MCPGCALAGLLVLGMPPYKRPRQMRQHLPRPRPSTWHRQENDRDHHSTTRTRHCIAELLRLVGTVRRLAFDRSLPPSEAVGRIRDAFADYDAGS